jgi:hypothetical protein
VVDVHAADLAAMLAGRTGGVRLGPDPRIDQVAVKVAILLGG